MGVKGQKTFEKWVLEGEKSFEKWVSEGVKSFEKWASEGVKSFEKWAFICYYVLIERRDSMLIRSVWNDLLSWKKRKHHPLVISGLRQIGKTYIVREFGKQFYETVVYIDLRSNRSIHVAFEGDFNVDMMIMSITANTPSARFVSGKTLVILDEIQDCPGARSSLKYWDLDGRFDVIATGSFLGVKGFREPYVRGVPVGYEESLVMYPLTFEEFLLNAGITDAVKDYVEKCLTEGTMINKAIHESLRSLYLQYLIVGGMPEAVNTFFFSHDLNAVRKVQKRILSSIRDDFGRYKDSKGNDKVNEVLKLRAEGCLDSLPAQLSKDYKKFQYSLVNTKGKSTDKAEGLQYLIDVGLVVKSYNIKEIVSPLEGVKIPTEFKVFYSDTGLLISQLDQDTVAKLLSGDLSSYKGAIAENMVAVAFMAHNLGLYYFHAQSGSPELDFIVSYRGETIIVECKSSNNRATSMKYVLSKPEKYGKHPAVKIADTNVGGGDGFKTYPLYALGFLGDKHEEENIAPVIDLSGLQVPDEI